MKHLSKIGLVVSFEQNFLHEFDYTVSNLAVDLRDGLRLARLAEILMAHASRSTNVNSACGFDERMLVSKQLRVPVISRLQKVFNVKTAIRYLQELGVDMSCRGGEIRDVDICDGHRHKTLALLWKVIAKFDLGCQVNIAKLSAECKRIGTPSVDLQLEESAVEACSAPEALALLRWTDTICAVYNKRVNDFSLSFADGRALCFLIHHYHPAMLPLTAIAKTTMTQSVGEDGQVGDRAKYEALLAGERKNFQTVNAIVQQLGHMPFMLSKWDSTNVPEEKTMIVFLAYLHERLMDSYEQVMATQTLQRAWRNIKIQRQMAKHLTKVIALQYRVRRFLAKKLKNSQRDASITIQKWLKRMPLRFALSASIVYARKRISAAKELQYFWKTKGMAITRSKHVQAAAATKLQQNFRRFLAVHRFNTASQSCIKMQAFVRGSQQKRTFYAQRGASTQLQATVRAWIAKRRFATAKFGIIQLQSLARSATVRSMFQRQKSACVAIQAVLRGFFSATQFNKSRSAVSTISSHWRMHHQSNVYKAQRDSAIAAQACIRGFLAASKFQQKQLAADVIQSMWRSMVAKWSAQQTLADAKTAATTINAFGRQIVARAAFARAVRSAIRMQATIRGFFGATQFTNCRNAVTTIAAQWRMHHQFTSYKQQRAAVVLQSWWTSMSTKWSAQQTLADAKQAVTRINAYSRQLLAQRAFARKRSSVVKMQAILRTFFRASTFTMARAAVTKISSHWRMIRHFNDFNQQRSSTIILQTVFRGHNAALAFQQQKKSAQVIQSTWRSTTLKWAAQQQFAQSKAASTTINAFSRQVLARRALLEALRASVCIQASVRSFFATNHFRSARDAATTICSQWRMHINFANFKTKRASAIAAQARIRGFLAFASFHQQKYAASEIQSTWRLLNAKWAAQHQFTVAKAAATSINAFSRQVLARRSFLECVENTVKIQAVLRRFFGVTNFNMSRMAVTTISGQWRMYKLFSAYQSKRSAAIVAQSRVRGFIATVSLRRQKMAGRVIQSTWRALICKWTAQQQFFEAKAAATSINAFARQSLARCSFIRSVNASVTLQAVLRGFFSATQFNKSRSAVSTISSHWRMHHQSNVYKAQRDSAIAAQACIRGFLAASKFQQKQLAADVIQSMWRSMVAKWSAQQTLADAKTAATTINAFGRQIVARAAFARAVRSAIRMQATIRGFFGATQFTNCRNAVTTIAAQWRMHHQFTSYKQQRAAVVLQSWWKSMCAKWSAQQTLADAKTAATTINAFGRQIVARMVFARAVRSAIQMQAIIRGFFGTTHFYRCRNAVTTISAQWRMSCRRGAFVSKLHSITVIQSIVRAHIDRRRYGAFRAAATLVSSQWRRVAERRCYLALKRSAIVSQAAVRAVTARTQFVAQRAAAVLIANAFRRHLVKQAQQRLEARASRSIQALCRAAAARASWKAKRAAAIAIVSNAKRFQAQRLYNKQKSSAIRVQACVRKLIQRQQFCSLRQATTTLSKNMRASFARQSFMQQRKFCVAIQQFWKTRIAVARFADVKCAALTCQRIWRASHKVRRAATRLQCWTRVIAAQKVLQALQARAAEIRREQLLRRQQKAAKTIKAFLSLTHFKRRLRVVASAVRVTQSFIRGYRIRKKNTKKLQMIRQRLREANRKYSKALSIGALSNQALTTLLTNKSLAAVMHACSTLEMVTRYSRNCSRHFIEHDATNILFKLMASSNRSEPHQKLIIVCLGIIKNLRAWGQLISSSTHLLGETEMLTLVDLLQNYREKPAIAIRSLTLFVQELSQPDLRECIRNNAPVMRRLNSIRNLSAKKAKALKTSARANTSTNRTAKKRNSANTMHALMTKLQKMLE